MFQFSILSARLIVSFDARFFFSERTVLFSLILKASSAFITDIRHRPDQPTPPARVSSPRRRVRVPSEWTVRKSKLNRRRTYATRSKEGGRGKEKRRRREKKRGGACAPNEDALFTELAGRETFNLRRGCPRPAHYRVNEPIRLAPLPIAVASAGVVDEYIGETRPAPNPLCHPVTHRGESQYPKRSRPGPGRGAARTDEEIDEGEIPS